MTDLLKFPQGLNFKFGLNLEQLFWKMFGLDSEIYGRVSKKWNDMMF